MFSSDFETYFNHLNVKKYFIGVYPIDRVPRVLKNEHFLICNTDTSNNEGQHWFAVYRNGTLLECFDSLGITAERKQSLEIVFKLKGINKIIFNTTQLQASDSASCGQFCIYFIVERLHNKDLNFSELLDECFDVNVTKNEKTINMFMKDTFQK